ncbi:MAG TPA: MFS transporter [Acidimicrobiales bacterium]|nr:MFS transporter [Acidimicrobiales bacterium]
MAGRILVDTTPLRESRDFRFLFSGQLVSTLGNQLTVVAIPYQTFRLTHSSLQVGAVSLAQLFPFIAGALLGGPIGDSVDRRRIMLWSVAVMSLTSAGLAFNASVSHPSLLALYLVSSLASGFMGFANTARMASVPALVERRHIPAANAMTQITFQAGVIVGPALSGLLLGIGLPLVYGIDAGTFLIALAATLPMAPIPPVAGAGAAPDGGRVGVWQSTREGMRFLRSRQALQGVYIVDINAMVFGLPRALFPAMAGSVFHGGTLTLGFLYASPGAGALVGALTTGWVSNVRRQGATVIWAVIAWGAAVTVFGLVHLLAVALVMLAVAGWADVISAVLRNTIIQSSIPDRFRSRMSSIQMAVVQGGPRVGDMESGGVATATSIPFSIVSGGLACIVGAVVIAACMPRFRHHEAVVDEPEEWEDEGSPGELGSIVDGGAGADAPGAASGPAV